MIRKLFLIISAITLGYPNASAHQQNHLDIIAAVEPTKTSSIRPVVDHDDATRENHNMFEDFIQFIKSPDRDTYLTLQERIISSDAYEPYSDELDIADELYGQQKIEEAQNIIQNGMPNLMLSPIAHQLLGLLFHKLGDEQSAQMEIMINRACIEGILTTGDGSVNNPYIVVRPSDEFDLIRHFEKEIKQQSLTHKGDKHLDLIVCKDDSEYWFDITNAYSQHSLAMSYRHVATGINFPAFIATLVKKEKVFNFETKQPGYGVSLKYDGLGIKVTVYVYTMGFKNIPSNLTSSTLQDQFKQATGEILLSKKMGHYSKLKKLSEDEVNWGNGEANIKSLHASYILTQEGKQLLSHLHLLGFKNHFLKIRYTYDSNVRKTAEKVQKDFLKELSDILGRTEKEIHNQ